MTTDRYTIRAHPTRYAGTLFRSRLEARWAAFFDLVGWHWEYEPVDLAGWSPDFYVRYFCGHSDCPPYHELYVEVKPYRTIGEFADHAVAKMDAYQTPTPAMFGIEPDVTEWEMCHGAGGGIFRVSELIHDAENFWREAGNLVQWKR